MKQLLFLGLGAVLFDVAPLPVDIHTQAQSVWARDQCRQGANFAGKVAKTVFGEEFGDKIQDTAEDMCQD